MVRSRVRVSLTKYRFVRLAISIEIDRGLNSSLAGISETSFDDHVEDPSDSNYVPGGGNNRFYETTRINRRLYEENKFAFTRTKNAKNA